MVAERALDAAGRHSERVDTVDVRAERDQPRRQRAAEVDAEDDARAAIETAEPLKLLVAANYLDV